MKKPNKTIHKAEVMPDILLDESPLVEDVNGMKLCMKFPDEVDKEFGLTGREVLFCQLYYNPLKFGNHILSYSQAFDEPDKDRCNREGMKLLRKKPIKALLAAILSIYADRETGRLILQNKSAAAKLGAIKLTKELDGELKQSVEHIHIHTSTQLRKLTDEELNSYIQISDKIESETKLLEDGKEK